MSTVSPQAGQRVPTQHGTGTIERVFYGTVTQGRRRFVICTVALDVPYQDKHKHTVTRIEAEVTIHRSRRYDQA